MIKHFHGYEIELNDYERNGSKYVCCLIESRERPFTPEEGVRQAVIDYLMNLSDLNLDNFEIRVEHKSLDIVFYFLTEIPNFCPSLQPALIIETKRDFINIIDWEYQILNYLRRDNCNKGLLLNSQQIFSFNKVDTGYRKQLLNISDLDNDFFNINKPFSEVDIDAFYAACEGNFESFKFLASKYGRNSKVSFLCKGYNAPIDNAFYIRIIAGYICFDVSGEISKARQTKIKADCFIKLLSIKE